MPTILSAETESWYATAIGEGVPPAAVCLRRCRTRRHWPPPGPPERLWERAPLMPTVAQGRWIIACPDCGGTQVASKTDRRFFCTDCGNRRAGGRWRGVVWPVTAAGIEAALEPRQDRAMQNWRGEHPNDLLDDNRLRRLVSP